MKDGGVSVGMLAALASSVADWQDGPLWRSRVAISRRSHSRPHFARLSSLVSRLSKGREEESRGG